MWDDSDFFDLEKIGDIFAESSNFFGNMTEFWAPDLDNLEMEMELDFDTPRVIEKPPPEIQ